MSLLISWDLFMMWILTLCLHWNVSWESLLNPNMFKSKRLRLKHFRLSLLMWKYYSESYVNSRTMFVLGITYDTRIRQWVQEKYLWRDTKSELHIPFTHQMDLSLTLRILPWRKSFPGREQLPLLLVSCVLDWILLFRVRQCNNDQM